jgi:uncharacterized protein
MHPVTDVLIKPAGPDCNLACDYCFYLKKMQPTRGRRPRMSEMVIETLIRQLLAQPVPQISIGWQGGEPALMGLPFYRKAVDYMQRYGRGQAISNGFQTNGVLMDGPWAKFFSNYNFLVGLSLDGPEHIHDHYRRNRAGRGSWRKVLDAAKLMLDSGVEVNVLSVVNSYSVQFPDEIYAFHKANGLNFMQFIPCLETDGSRVADFSVNGATYGSFLCRLFDLWLADFIGGAPTTSIRWFEALLFQYAGFPPSECTLLETCGDYLLIEHSGDVYTCDFFVVPSWKLGNLLETPLPELFHAPKQSNFRAMKSNLPDECRTCEWRTQCRGGCPKDRLPGSASAGCNYLCAAYQQFFPYADARLRGLVAGWESKNQSMQ